jgi:riboflavin synthase
MGMFTGIITDVGELSARQGGRFTLRCAFAAESIALGASICCDGACLTVTDVAAAAGESCFSVDVSSETLERTTLRDWRPGRRVNLERALRAGDELGGHLVTGHVDGVAQILAIEPDGACRRFAIAADERLAPLIASKGSVALDGVSLTVNAVEDNRFAITIIPHTLTHTAFGDKKPGDGVNLEVDLFARYVARLMEMRR